MFWVAVAFAALSGIGAAYQILALACVAAHRRREPPRGPTPGISVLKPCRGAEPALESGLRAFLEQDYPEFEVLAGVESGADAALPILRGHEGDRLRVVVAPATGPNFKAGVVQALLAQAKHEIVVIADSDVVPSPGLLATLATELLAADVVSAPYAATGSPIRALWINTDFVPSAHVAACLSGVKFALGAVMATKRSVLTAIGYERMNEYLADDYHLGAWAAAKGYRVGLSRAVVRIEDASAAPLSQLLRWCRTIRVSQPAGYFASVITHGLFWSLVGVAASLAHPVALAALGGFALVRTVAVLRLAGPARAWFWLWPARDLLGTALWALAFAGNRVTWRGRTYRVARDGRVTAEPGSSRQSTVDDLRSG